MKELKEEWTFDDVRKANAILDMKSDQQEAYEEYNNSGRK